MQVLNGKNVGVKSLFHCLFYSWNQGIDMPSSIMYMFNNLLLIYFEMLANNVTIKQQCVLFARLEIPLHYFCYVTGPTPSCSIMGKIRQ